MKSYKDLDIKLLYIEDDNNIRESVTNILSLLLKDVHSLDNAKEALNYIEKNHVDIIVTDIQMPKLNGLDFIEILKNKSINIPVIVVTAFTETNYLLKAIELKVDKFITKPINVNDLIETIGKIIEVIIDKKELDQKKLELESYKKAIHLSSLVLVVKKDGSIIEVSNSLKEFIYKKLNLNIENNNLFKIGEYYTFEDINKKDKNIIEKELLKKVLNFEIFSRDIILNIKNDEFTLNMTAFASKYEGKNISEITLIFKNFTSLLEEKNKTIKNLHKDLTTNFPNKHSLINKLNLNKANSSLVFLSIDDFKKIRHSYGLKISDKILVNIARSLETFSKSECNKNYIIYKIEEDTFALLIDDGLKDSTKQIAMSISKYFDNYEIDINGLQINTPLTIGASCSDKTDLYHEALIALDFAITQKKELIFFDEIDNNKEFYKKNIIMQQKLKKALHNEKVQTYFQPIVDKEGQVKKYEALARIIDPEDNEKILFPNEFLNIIKNSKNYEQFTKQIIKKALEDSDKLKSNVSINLSFDDISNPEIINYLKETLKQTTHEITIEFLESEGMQDLEKTKQFCNLMHSYGAKIAIDDFGSGYSNYDYFLEIPLDIIKIDGSLIKKANDYKGYLLLESIIYYAKKSDILTIAEFVENKEYFNILKGLGIDLFQGYYFDKAKAIKDIIDDGK